MPRLRVPAHIDVSIDGHSKWLRILNEAEKLVKDDSDLQAKVAKGLRLKERRLPPEVLGRMYSQYCDLINRMYDTYLNNVHLQRAEYIKDLIAVFVQRMFELRHELVHFIVNDYIYVDGALQQLFMTPPDIQIVVPYHFPLESRPDSVEQLFQKMWSEAVKRKIKKNKPPKQKVEKPPKYKASRLLREDDPEKQNEEEEAQQEEEEEVEEEEEDEIVASVHTILSEEYIQTLIIQRHERFRQFYTVWYQAKCAKQRIYFGKKSVEVRMEIKERAAIFIQTVYREYMAAKREHFLDTKRSILLGMLPDVHKRPLKFVEENNKIYEKRRATRQKIEQIYLSEMEKENLKLIRLNKDNQIDDITDEIRDWFMEWYRGYEFFPQYPWPTEGGTLLVIRGQYPTIDEQKEEDEIIRKKTKGKSKDQLKEEKEQERRDEEAKAEQLKEAMRKEAEALLKARKSPRTDPGYEPKQSEVMPKIAETLRNYRLAWSIYDDLAPKEFAEVFYGFLKPVLTEDLMTNIHLECRALVDELMRLELKLFVKAQKKMYKRCAWKYPKQRLRKRPPVPKPPKLFVVDDRILRGVEVRLAFISPDGTYMMIRSEMKAHFTRKPQIIRNWLSYLLLPEHNNAMNIAIMAADLDKMVRVMDLDIISRPKNKISDIDGDYSFMAYDVNIADPTAKFPIPGYGDIKRRLVLSGIFGTGIEPTATRVKSLLLIGQERNGKSFLVDCIAGEMNAIKIDISPEVFSSKVRKPGRLLNNIFNTARVFEPAVIFLKNIERVFCKRVAPQDRRLKAKSMKTPLKKCMKNMASDSKTIFIATCSYPLAAKAKPMMSLFSQSILVPRVDYGTVQHFFYERLLKITSIPSDICVAWAKCFQGIGYGHLIEMYDHVITPERLVRLNVELLQPSEFLECLIEKEIEPLTKEEFQAEYTAFYLKNSPLKHEREEYIKINESRKEYYDKMAAKEAKKNK